MYVRTKICGLTTAEDVAETIAAGADALGFVFANGSKRLVSPVQAAQLTRNIPVFIARVGLFVNETPETVERITRDCRLDTLQFHGEESPEYCARFQNIARVIKAFRVRDLESLTLELAPYSVSVDAILLDAFVPGQHGGTGARFDWEVARAISRNGTSVILAGGLDPSNVDVAIRQALPFAVDVSSGVEQFPGRKDPNKVRQFITQARKAASTI